MFVEKFNLEGKVAVVTGAGRGLGKQMALALARAGADVVCAARTKDQVEATAAEVSQIGRRALAIPADVTKSEEADALIQQALAHFGHIDILVNNAGGGDVAKPIWEITDAEWHAGIDRNLSSAFFCSRAVARHMVERKQGKIINLASGYGLRGGRNVYMYGCGKGGVVQLTRVLALSLAEDNIQVNAIAPGFFPHFDRLNPQQAEDVRSRERFQASGRYGDPKELGPLAVFLASAASDYMTGAVIPIDGAGMAASYAPTGYAATVL